MKWPIKILLGSILSLVITAPGMAQETAIESQSPPKSICETEQHFADFDFLIAAEIDKMK